MIAWTYAVHGVTCSSCRARIGQGERTLIVRIAGVKRDRFYCEAPCGERMATEARQDVPVVEDPRAAVPTLPALPARHAEPDGFDSMARMAERFAKRPQSKERFA